VKKIKNIFGFTLVELMVVVAVIIVLTGIGAASLNKINNTQELEGLKNELMNSLSLARSMAVTNQLPAEVSDSLKYVLVVMSSGTSMRADAVMVSGSNQTYFTKENNSITTNSSFGFSIENGRLTDSDGILVGDPLCFSLYLASNPTNIKYVYIDTSGLIYEKNNCN